MHIIDDMRKALSTMSDLSPKNMKPMGYRESFLYFWKAGLLPTILLLIIAVSLIGVVVTFFGELLAVSHMAGLLALGAAAIIIANYILTPVWFLIGAAVLHLFGKYIFRSFKRPLEDTFAAVTYGSTVPYIFIWINALPLIGSLLSLIFHIWGWIITIFALSNFNKISRLKAFVSVLGTAIIVLAVLFAVSYTLVAPFFGSYISNIMANLNGKPASYNTTTITPLQNSTALAGNCTAAAPYNYSAGCIAGFDQESGVVTLNNGTISIGRVTYPASVRYSSYNYNGQDNSSYYNAQFSPEQTFVLDGNYGILMTYEAQDLNYLSDDYNPLFLGSDGGASWMWDFGKPVAGNFTVSWRANAVQCAGVGSGIATVAIGALNDTSSTSNIDWKNFTSVNTSKSYSFTTTKFSGKYRYIVLYQSPVFNSYSKVCPLLTSVDSVSVVPN